MNCDSTGCTHGPHNHKWVLPFQKTHYTVWVTKRDYWKTSLDWFSRGPQVLGVPIESTNSRNKKVRRTSIRNMSYSRGPSRSLTRHVCHVQLMCIPFHGYANTKRGQCIIGSDLYEVPGMETYEKSENKRFSRTPDLHQFTSRCKSDVNLHLGNAECILLMSFRCCFASRHI